MKGSSLKIKNSLAIAVIISSIICFSIGFQGCVTVQTAPPQEVRAMLFKEGGYNLAFYALQAEPDAILDRTKKVLYTAMVMTEKTDPGEMVMLISDYVQEMPQFKNQHEQYFQFVGSAVRLLDGLLEINIEIPENQKHVVVCLKAFLSGAFEGVEELERLRRPESAKRLGQSV